MGGLVDYMCGALKGGMLPYDAGTVDIAMCDENAAATAAKGFPVSNALARAESCGFVTDPRCTHGASVSTMLFSVNFANVDSTSTCASTSAPTASLKAKLSKVLSAAEKDIDVDLCPASSRRLQAGNTLQPRVTIEGSGATNLGLAKSLKKNAVASGSMGRELDKVSGLTATSGKVITLSNVGADTTGTKSGVSGSTPAQVSAAVVQAEANKKGTTSAAAGWTLGSTIVFSIAVRA